MVAISYRLPEIFFLLGGKTQVLAISAWADESEAKEHEFLCLAAYLSSVKRWRRFASEWHRSVPESFHMVEFRNPRSRLRRSIGSPEKAELLAQSISSIIRSHTVQGIVVTINPVQYKHLTSKRFRSQYGSAYTFAGMMLWEVIRVWVEDSRYRGLVNFWLEEGHVHGDELMQKIWAHKRDSPIKSLIGDFGFGSKTENPPLQAADVLAYSAYETLLRPKRKPGFELGTVKRLHCSPAFIKERIVAVENYHNSQRDERHAKNAAERDARLLKQLIEKAVEFK